MLAGFSAVLLLSSFPACQKKPVAPAAPPAPAVQAPTPVPPPPAPPQLVSAEPNSFDAIAKHLDSGGGMYLYFSTETLLKTLSENGAGAVPALLASDKMDDAQKLKAAAVWNSLRKVAAQSGLKQISGFGASTIALEPGYYQNKWMLHHYPGQSDGLIWKLSGSTPNALDLIAYLPEKTALASSGNLKLEPIWNALNQEAANNPDLKRALETAVAQFQQKTGLDLPALLASLGPNFTLTLTLDESHPTPLPAANGEQPQTIPEPALLISIEVQDDVLINKLDQELSKNPMVAKSEEDGLTLRTLVLPIPLPFVRPTVAWKKGLLILASNDALIHEMLAVKAGRKPGLAANALFKKLMTGLPETGCNFGYISPLLQKTVRTVQLMQLAQDKKTDPAVKKLIESLYKIVPTKTVCGVTQETSEGWIGIRHDDTGAAVGK